MKIKTSYSSAIIIAATLALTLPKASGVSLQNLNGSTVTPTSLVNSLLGGGITASSISYTGANSASGLFSSGTADGIGVDSGVLLTTGSTANAVGPTSPEDDQSTDNGRSGDSDIDAILSPQSLSSTDASVLTFNFVPTGTMVSLQAVFASEEYNDWVNSSYNDIFAVFIKAPGSSTWTPVPANGIYEPGLAALSVNDINFEKNIALYQDNTLASYGSGYDGFTSVLTFKATVTSGQTYGMKLAIADTSDHNLDSGVFLKAGSLQAGSPCTAGTLDTSFSSGSSGPSSTVNSIVPLASGKILIGGTFGTYEGTTTKGVVRINSDGTRDTSFTTGGFTTGSGGVYQLAIQPYNGENKILLVGAYAATSQPKCARLNADGTLDSSFTGTDATLIGSSDTATIAVQPDSYFLVGGKFSTINGSSRKNLARFLPDGSLEGSPGWYAGTGPNDDVYYVSVQGDGKILVAGNFTTYHGYTRSMICRLNSDGTMDTGFAGPTFNNTATGIQWQPDGKILVIGSFTTVNGSSKAGIVRLTSTGSVDSGWSSSGTGGGSPFALLQEPTGKIWIGGSFTSVGGTSINKLARLNTDGTIDTSFSSGTGPGSTVWSLGFQPDSKLLLGGSFTTYNSTTAKRLARICNMNLY